MADSDTTLDLVSAQQAGKDVTVDELIDGLSPAIVYGRHAKDCAGLTWAFYGGPVLVSGGALAIIANGEITLTASATCYVRAAKADGSVDFVTSAPSGWPSLMASYVALYEIPVGADAPTDWLDRRAWVSLDPGAGGGGGGSVTLTGDVTGSGTGSFATTIASHAVTLAKMAQIASARFLGRITASTGDVESLTGTQATSLLDAMVGDIGSGGTKGLVPAPGAGDAAAGKFLKANGTYAVPPGSGGTVPTGTGFRHVTSGAEDGAAQSVDLSTAEASGILAAARFPILTGDVTTGGGALATTIANSAVTNAKLANAAAHTFKGNNTGSSAAPIDMTATQATAELNDFVGDTGTGGTKGLVPAPSAGDAATDKVLKANGTWGDPGTDIPGAPTTLYQIEFVIGDGTNPIVTGCYPTAVVSCPRAGTITGWRILSCDAASPTSGSITFDVWKDVFASYPPDVSNTIIPSGTKPNMTAAASASGSTLTGWTTSIAVGDVLFVNVDTVTSLKSAKLVITYSI